MNKQDLQKYILDVYGVIPDFPWENDLTSAVYRHTNNRKWFALVMYIPKSKLGLREDGMIDVVNLKCDPVLIGSLIDDEQIKMLIDMSFELTALKIQRKKENKT